MPPVRKLDLLADCNDQKIPPNEFRGIFCQRCRNPTCTNAGWSGSSWESRMATQVSRLLSHPNYADPLDPKFTSLRALKFLEIQEPVVLNPRDPWEGPGVHFASPDTKLTSSSEVDYAVRALTGSMGSPVKPPVEVVPQVSTQVTVAPDDPPPPQGLGMNTPFLDGVMLGDPRGVDPNVNPQPQPVAYDPWDPKNAKRVQAGAKIKMGP